MIAILAFGSLLDSPGTELEEATLDKRGVRTPFCVEYARLSRKRCGAPTLVPVDTGGGKVQASLLVLGEHISRKEAKNMLWRRETDQVGSGKCYRERSQPTPDTVLIKELNGFANIDHVLFVDFPPEGKRETLSADQLADAAINSVRDPFDGRDGISYLLNAIKSGVITPLTEEYKRTVLQKTRTVTLEEAYDRLCGD